MSRTIYSWRVRCLTDDRYEQWNLFDTDPAPTTCPVDTSHTIDSNDVTLRNVISQREVKIKEETVPTGGKWAAQSHWFYGATGGTTGPSETLTQITWPHDVSVFNVQYRSREQNERDQVTMFVETKDNGFGVGVIGTLTATAPTGATGITVSETVIENALVADWVKLDDGVNSTDYMQICDVNREARILYFFNPQINNEYNVASPTFIKFRRYVLRNYNLGPPDLYQLGNGKIGGSYVPAGNIVNIIYRNFDSTQDKELFAYIERLE